VVKNKAGVGYDDNRHLNLFSDGLFCRRWQALSVESGAD